MVISTEESVKHISNIVLNTLLGVAKRPSSGHPLINNLVKSVTYEMLAHSGIPYSFTRMVKNKIR
jgi:hypothetical protein